VEAWLTAAARERPDHPAVVADDGSATYAELLERASERARALGPGRVLSATMPPSLAFAELMHAASLAGAAFMPLAPGARLAVADAPTRDDVHTLIHTSGTTGQPKPVELTYANHVASAAAAGDALGVEPADRWLCPMPVHHVGGLCVLVRCAINRTTAVLHERFDAQRVKQTLEAGEVTLASLVPTMLARLREAGLRSAPGLRAIALGGGPIPPALLEWARGAGIPVVPVYGMTETCSQVVAGSPGRPLRGVELRISPAGEILVRGPMVAPGEIAADGWLHTGDLGRLDAEGLLHVEGRLKEVIVTGGENVAPVEVERVLAAHPAVVDAGVTGVPDPDWGERLTAFVVLRQPESSEGLRRWCSERLEPFKVPKAFHTVAALPRNANGKLLRDKLQGGRWVSSPPS
jgi:O-succinylbenzoic acid--CoA ligase